ncbi:hypothetical protein J4430_01920 [Candidatus Woesearchaeota archaeon]|nr:hypothetical protein [Candidatus Woesearchaeota archaeon]
MNDKIGSWAFLAGVLIAVILGLIGGSLGGLATSLGWILVLIGLLVGLLNITEKESVSFMMAGAVLVVVSSLGGDVFSSNNLSILGNILQAILVLFVPATIVVAVKSVFGYARRK